MGCCFCRPLTAVREDPDVIVWAFVGATAEMYGPGDSELISACRGLLYVKGRQLHYKSRSCLGRSKQKSWSLSDVKEVAAVRDFNIHKSVDMDPGLQIIFKDTTGGTSTLVSSMPQAVEFSKKLKEHIRGSLMEPKKEHPPKKPRPRVLA